MARSLLVALLFAAFASAAQLAVQSARFTITSDGEQSRTESLKVGDVPKAPLSLGQNDILKLSFAITEKGNDKGIQPHQTFLRFYDAETGEEGIQPIRVTSGGKAKFELNMARPPASLPPTTTSPLRVSLIVGSFNHSPLKADLFDLVLPVSAPPPQHPDEATFHPLPEIQHTFRPDPKSPPKVISLVFSGVVLAPWIVLLGLLSQIPYKLPLLFSPSILGFITLLGAFEGLLLYYWVALRIGQVLAYGAALSVVTAFAGNRALNTIATWRVEGTAKSH